MAKNGDRGSLLLGVRIHPILWTVLIWTILTAVALTIVAQLLKTRDFSGWYLIPLSLPQLTYALHPRIKFFAGGLEIPPTSGQRYLSLTWLQVDRYSWDGDTLILAGTNSVLSGGPVESSRIRIPPGRHLAVEQIVSMKVRKA